MKLHPLKMLNDGKRPTAFIKRTLTWIGEFEYYLKRTYRKTGFITELLHLFMPDEKETSHFIGYSRFHRNKGTVTTHVPGVGALVFKPDSNMEYAHNRPMVIIRLGDKFYHLNFLLVSNTPLPRTKQVFDALTGTTILTRHNVDQTRIIDELEDSQWGDITTLKNAREFFIVTEPLTGRRFLENCCNYPELGSWWFVSCRYHSNLIHRLLDSNMLLNKLLPVPLFTVTNKERACQHFFNQTCRIISPFHFYNELTFETGVPAFPTYFSACYFLQSSIVMAELSDNPELGVNAVEFIYRCVGHVFLGKYLDVLGHSEIPFEMTFHYPAKEEHAEFTIATLETYFPKTAELLTEYLQFIGKIKIEEEFSALSNELAFSRPIDDRHETST